MKNGARKALLPLGDIAMLFIAFFIMLEVSFPGKISQGEVDSHFLPFMVIFGVWILVFFLFNLYDPKSVKPTIPNLKKIGGAYVVALTASTILFYTVPYFGITPKTNLVIFATIFVVLFMAWRRLFYKIFSVYFRKNVAFVIDPENDKTSARELIDYIENYPQSGFIILGKYSSVQELTESQNIADIDTLIVSRNTLRNSAEIGMVYNKVKNVFDLADAYEEILGKIPVDSVDETWLLHNIKNTDKALYVALSQIMSIFFALVILAVASPFLLLVSLFVKIEDRGRIFYSQKRVGKNGKIFSLYKFRSMVPGADKTGAEWTENNDSRITRVGKIIRKLHIDEIPQLLNVIRGDMALVGPRPEIPSFAEKMEKEVSHYSLRHIIIPGFTGWAQIKFRNARGVSESKEKFEYDLYYIKNRNIFMDLGIILRTVVIIFTHD